MEYINKVNVGGVDHIVQTPTNELIKQFSISEFKMNSSGVIGIKEGDCITIKGGGLSVYCLGSGGIVTGYVRDNVIMSGLALNILSGAHKVRSQSGGVMAVPLYIITGESQEIENRVAIRIGSGLQWNEIDQCLELAVNPLDFDFQEGKLMLMS